MPDRSIGMFFHQNNKIFLAYASIWHKFMRYLHYQVQNFALWNN